MSQDFTVSCEHWTLPRGDSLSEAIITKRITTSEKYEYPALDDTIDEKRAILLVAETLQPCNVHIGFPTSCCAHVITIITDCQKLEVFLGKSEEYFDICYGELIDDFEDTRVYRFDVDVSTTSQSELNLKFIPKTTSFWIYGMTIAIKPNLKALSSSMFGPSVDFNHVQSILADSKHKLTPSAEKCKEFLQTYAQSKVNLDCSSIVTMMNGNLLGGNVVGNSLNETNNVNGCHNGQTVGSNDEIYSRLVRHLDRRMDDMEQRINTRLDDFERRQNEKFDIIIDVLSKHVEK